MSIFDKNWKISKSAPAEFFELVKGLKRPAAQVLYNRGLRKKEEVEKFLKPNYSKDLNDPYLLKDIKKAAHRIIKALKAGENILIYGDYDADGVCASTVLNKTLKKLGGNVKVYIPDRHDEGYGMSTAAVERFVKEGINLIITVDCGSTNVDEVEFAQKKSVDVIVTDHHQVLNNTDFCYALVNPQRKDDKYPFKGLSGTAVGFKLVQVLLQEAKSDKEIKVPHEGWEKWLLDLVAIATVTDVMPLVGENRTLVKYGLLVLQKTHHLGLKELIKLSGSSSVDAFTLGFVIGPRLNAAGRMQHADLAFNLLNTNDKQVAKDMANELERLNSKRKNVVSRILKDLETEDLETEPAIVRGNSNWPIGVLGIAAGRIADRYNKPVFLYQKKVNTFVGSARTPEFFNVVNILAEADNFLQKFGGHAQAGGFTAEIRHEENLANSIKNSAKKYLSELGENEVQGVLNIDTQVEFKDINESLYNELLKLSPFGQGNPAPTFLLKNVCISNPQMVGKDKNHFRCHVVDDTSNTSQKKAIGFRFEGAEHIKEGDRVDIVFNLGIDEWNGNRQVSLELLDIKRTE